MLRSDSQRDHPTYSLGSECPGYNFSGQRHSLCELGGLWILNLEALSNSQEGGSSQGTCMILMVLTEQTEN